MKKPFFLLIIFCMFSMSACGFNCNLGYSPIDLPNTSWNAKEIDMSFHIDEFGLNLAKGKINIEEEKEIVVIFLERDIVWVIEKNDYENGRTKEPLFSGVGDISFEKIIIKLYDNDKGILPDDIEEITFIREEKK